MLLILKIVTCAFGTFFKALVITFWVLSISAGLYWTFVSDTIFESLHVEEPLKKIECTHTNDSGLSFEVGIDGATLQPITDSKF